MSALSSFELDTADFDIAPDRGTETPLCGKPGCPNHVTKPARGRLPKFCDEHKQGTPAKGNTPPRKAAGTWPKATAVENALNAMFGFAGMGIALVNPKDGEIIAEGAPNVVKALVNLGREDKKLRKTLELLAAPGKYGELTVAVAGIVIPVMVNHKLIPELKLFSIGGE